MAHQRQPPSPRSCRDISPRPSITIGKAVPSLSPPSPVSPKRKRSRSCGSETCTSDASTGSVGARMAPSNTATPSGRSMSHTPAAARAPTVISMDTVASCTGMRQRPSRHGSSSLSPTVKSEMSTAISVRRSKSEASSIGSSTSRPNPQGPMPTPTAKYRTAELSGTRAMNELVNVMTTSSRPTRAKAIAGISSSDMEAQGRTRRHSAHCGVHAFPRVRSAAFGAVSRRHLCSTRGAALQRRAEPLSLGRLRVLSQMLTSSRGSARRVHLQSAHPDGLASSSRPARHQKGTPWPTSSK